MIEEWQKPIDNDARRWLRNDAEAADATQDILIELLRKAPTIQEPQRTQAWFYRVASPPKAELELGEGQAIDDLVLTLPRKP